MDLRSFEEFSASPEGQWLNDLLLSSAAALAPLAQLCKQNGRGISGLREGCLDAIYSSAQELKVIFEDQFKVYRLFSLSHHREFLLEILFPAYAWLLRYAAPGYGGEAVCVAKTAAYLAAIKGDVEAVVMSLLGRKFIFLRHENNAEEAWLGYVTLLVRMDTLKCVSQTMHGRRLLLAQHSSLSQLYDRMDDAARALVVLPAVRSAKGMAFDTAEVMFNTALVQSCFLEQACALRLQLANSAALAELLVRNQGAVLHGSEQTARVSEEGEKLLPDTSVSQSFRRVMDGYDDALLHLLEECSFGWADRIWFRLGWNEDLRCQPRCVPERLVLWPALSHPAVQCYLGWWLVAPMVVLVRPGCSAHGLPSSLLASCPATHWGDQDHKLLVPALVAAARCWLHALRCPTVASPVPSQSSGTGAAADSASAPGGSRQTAETDDPQEGATAASRSHQAVPHLPYSARNMYDMLLPVMEYCVEKARSEMAEASLGEQLVSTFSNSLEALVECLQHMPLAAAARRLAGCWRLLTLTMTMGDDSTRRSELKSAPWRVCRLLRMVHRRQQVAGSSAAGVAADSPAMAPANECGTAAASVMEPPAPAIEPEGLVAAEPLSTATAATATAAAAAAAAEAPVITVAAGEGRPQASIRPQQRLPYALTCAISSGIVPAMEAALRCELRSSRDAVHLESACIAVDLALRRPGCWPALLAYAEPHHVAALIATMTKMTRLAERIKPDYSYNNCNPCTAWKMQLLALLEQMAPSLLQWWGEVGSEGLDLGTAGQQAPDLAREIPGHERPISQQRQISLGLSRRLYGDWRACSGEQGVGGSCNSDCGAGALPSAPSWEEVVRAGGRPAPGTPAQVQQAHLAVKAAVEWLPLLLTHKEGEDAIAALVIDLPPCRVVWQWLLILSQHCLLAHQRFEDAVAAGDPATTAVWATELKAWSTLLCDDVIIIEQIRNLVQLACHGDSVHGAVTASQDFDDLFLTGPFRDAEALPILAAALDVLEVLALVMPHTVASAMQGNRAARESEAAAAGAGGSGATDQRGKQQWAGRDSAQAEPIPLATEALPPAWGPGLPFDSAVISVLEGHGRQALVRRLGELAAGKEPSEFRSRVHSTVAKPAVLLPILCTKPLAQGFDFPRCKYGGCTNMAGESEAAMALKACGRCHRVSYCCVECQRADWAAVHRAQCVPRGGPGG